MYIRILTVITIPSLLFPTDWQAIDRVGPIEGKNIFIDPKGMYDHTCAAAAPVCYYLTEECLDALATFVSISPTEPEYHDKRFLHDFSYAGYHYGKVPIPPENPCEDWTDSATVYDITGEDYGCDPNPSPMLDGEGCGDAIQTARL